MPAAAREVATRGVCQTEEQQPESSGARRAHPAHMPVSSSSTLSPSSSLSFAAQLQISKGGEPQLPASCLDSHMHPSRSGSGSGSASGSPERLHTIPWYRGGHSQPDLAQNATVCSSIPSSGVEEPYAPPPERHFAGGGSASSSGTEDSQSWDGHDAGTFKGKGVAVDDYMRKVSKQLTEEIQLIRKTMFQQLMLKQNNIRATITGQSV
jgi:hypothetical protein